MVHLGVPHKIVMHKIQMQHNGLRDIAFANHTHLAVALVILGFLKEMDFYTSTL